jgi:hypothetical protein
MYIKSNRYRGVCSQVTKKGMGLRAIGMSLITYITI